MGYTVDFRRISIDDYREILRHGNLLPSRLILHQDLDARLDALVQAGMSSLNDLRRATSTTKKVATLADQTGLSPEYLTILRREINSLAPKSVPVNEFPEIDGAIIVQVQRAGLRSSRDVYAFYGSFADPVQSAEKLQISLEALHELYSLCSLVRINGVGALAARSFYEAGYKSVADVAHATAEEMLTNVSAINREKRYYKTKLGVKDFQFCIDYAKILHNMDNR